MTNEEKQEIVDEVVNIITTNSTSINEVEVITDVSNVRTLPCSKEDGTIVQVAVSTLAAPALAAASNANSAAISANSAAGAATKAHQEVVEEFGEIKENINTQIIPKCEVATEKAEQAANNIGNKKILVITEDQYTQLLNGEVIEIEGVQYTMDANTIYFCTEE